MERLLATRRLGSWQRKGAAFTGVKGQLHWLQINAAGTAS